LSAPRITIDQVLGEFQDRGSYRSFGVMTSGDSLGELIANAVVTELDHDGDEIRGYPIPDASNGVQEAALRLISQVHEKASVA
jgi:hypothetical protein